MIPLTRRTGNSGCFRGAWERRNQKFSVEFCNKMVEIVVSGAPLNCAAESEVAYSAMLLAVYNNFLKKGVNIVAK